jgi:hypothetical protein
MVDDWTHEAPFALIGRLADGPVLRRRLRSLLEQCAAAIKAAAEQG